MGAGHSSVAPKRRPEPRSGVLHRLPHGGDSSGVVVDLQDLNGEGPSGRAGWGGCGWERLSGPLAPVEPPPPTL